jgi:CelD/BcsL family acetyltransferase involved in cellulose biosynthesis
LASLAEEWDAMVTAMPRPSPFMLNAWLTTWWAHRSDDSELAVQIATRDGKLVGALPFHVRRRMGIRVAEFLGGHDSALADVLLADPADDETAELLVRRAAGWRQDAADLFGMPADSRLVAALGDASLHLTERVEAPVLDISRGWETVYREKTHSKKRNLHRRRRRQLAERGTVTIDLAKTPQELEAALEDAVRLHELRWEGRPDGSGFATPAGRAFYRAALARMAEHDIPRIITLRLDGRAIAFHLYFALCGRMYVHRLAFDPALGRYSPGLVNTLDAIEAAAAEGLTVVEFLGGDERYKVELADGFQPLHQGLGLARTPLGYAYTQARLGTIETRKRLKRSERVHKFYFEDLAPARRWLERVRSRAATVRS